MPGVSGDHGPTVASEVHSNLDPVTTALQLAFLLLFGVSVAQFLRRRGPIELSVMAIFGSFVACSS
jgi:hypothetical protein